MGSIENTASKLQAVTDAMLEELEAGSENGLTGEISRDKDRIIRDLVNHVKMQHQIIRNLNHKLTPQEQQNTQQSDKFVEFIENQVRFESLNTQKKDKLISRLASHIGTKQTHLKQSISRLSSSLASSNQRPTEHATPASLSVQQRKIIEEEIKAELVPQITEALRKELLTELDKRQKPSRRTSSDSTAKLPASSQSEPPPEKPGSTKAKSVRAPSASETIKKPAQAPVTQSNEEITAPTPDTVKKIRTAALKPTPRVKQTPAGGQAPAAEQQPATPQRPASKALPEAKKRAEQPEASHTLSTPASARQTIQPPVERAGAAYKNISWPVVGKINEQDEEDDEADEIDNERLFSLKERLIRAEQHAGLSYRNAPSLIEVTRICNGEIKDRQHVPQGQSYAIALDHKSIKVASNDKHNRCQISYPKNKLVGCVGTYQATSTHSPGLKPLNANSKRNTLKYTLPPDKVVFLKAGNDEYRLRLVPASQPCRVEEAKPEAGKKFKHFLQYSAAFHLVVLLLAAIFVALFNQPPVVEEEPRFAQVELQTPEPVKPTPEPKKPKPVEKPKVKKPEPKKDIKITKKPAAPKPKPKNAGGGSKEGGNIKKRDVKNSGLLAALGSKRGTQPANKQTLATVSSIDAVSSLNKDSAVLKVGGLAAKVQGARIEVASGELLNTQGSSKVLRSGGAEGSGQIAALDAGVTGNREVQGRVSATLSRKVKIQGGLSRDAVKAVIDAHMDEVVYCYEKSLLTNPSLAGKAVFEWKVLMSGRVGQVNIKSSSLRANDIHSCISGAIKSWQFPQPTGTSVFVSFPFIFDSVVF